MKGEYVGFKDTVNVKPLSYVDVAIIPTNVWTWAFHCHILEHADLGMFTTVIVEE
jgi:FtsP/CotA-like multicopper oxidase with cupredoxin domain